MYAATSYTFATAPLPGLAAVRYDVSAESLQSVPWFWNSSYCGYAAAARGQYPFPSGLTGCASAAPVAIRYCSPLEIRRLSYRELGEKLGALGVAENKRNLSNKISRGGFTAAFFLQRLAAIGCSTLRLDD